MSLSISTRYGSRANDPTLDYPTGSFKNKTAPDAVDGTPLEKDWANDLLGARDAILAEAGILANGVADTAQASQLLEALQALGLRAATETKAGVLEIATTAEAQALVSDTHALTPAKLAAVLGGGSLTPNGYAVFPIVIAGEKKELIIQWGATAFPDFAGSYTITSTFPITFPNGVLNIVDGLGLTTGFNTAAAINEVSITLSGFSAAVSEWNPVTQTGGLYRWFAIGY